MDIYTIWFFLWGLLWVAFFVLDGFDLGAGILYRFLGKTEIDKRAILNAIGPVWDGNEVWLVTAGGATYAAFPIAYGYMFSYLYIPLLLILFALIFRGASLELRAKTDSETLKKFWDYSFSISSFLIAFLFGVAFGNLFEGLPIDANGYHGNILTLLNPYGLITGLLSAISFTIHGGLWIAIRTPDEFANRTLAITKKLWYVQVVLVAMFMILTGVYTHLYDNFFKMPILFVVPTLVVISLILTGIFIMKNKPVYGFIFSFLFILTIAASGLIGLYPNLLLSSIDPQYSITAYNAAGSEYTLKIMLWVVIIFVPIVVAYQAMMYKLFSYKLTDEEIKKGHY